LADNVVSLIRYHGIESVADAIRLCGGFAGLRSGDRVLIKPNLVGWDDQGPYPPWGVLTTSVVVEGLCRALRDAGAGEISIGEGSVVCKTVGSSTGVIFDNLDYGKLTERYGARLIDFNTGEHDEIELSGGHKLKVSRHALECDFLVDVPVLKTHGQTKVSLGIKNLKGLLKSESKTFCHHADGLLEELICKLGKRLPPSLTMIDGIYGNEQGPLHFGRAHRMDLLIGSTDVYAADLLGAYILGYVAGEVDHLRMWSEGEGRPTDISELEIRGGVDPEDVRRPLKWDWEWVEGLYPQAFAKKGIGGLYLPKYDSTLCTGCSYMFNPLMLALLSLGGREYDGYEFLTGKKMRPSGRAAKTFLLGKCQCDLNGDNPDCGEAVPIRGCPPSMDRMLEALQNNGLPVSRVEYDNYRRHVMKRYLKRPEEYPLSDFYMGEMPGLGGL